MKIINFFLILLVVFTFTPNHLYANEKGIIKGFEDSTIETVNSNGEYIDLDVELFGPPEELQLVKILDSGMWKVKNLQGQVFIVDRGDLILDPNYKSRKNKGRGKCHDYSGAGVMGVEDCK